MWRWLWLQQNNTFQSSQSKLITRLSHVQTRCGGWLIINEGIKNQSCGWNRILWVWDAHFYTWHIQRSFGSLPLVTSHTDKEELIIVGFFSFDSVKSFDDLLCFSQFSWYTYMNEIWILKIYFQKNQFNICIKKTNNTCVHCLHCRSHELALFIIIRYFYLTNFRFISTRCISKQFLINLKCCKNVILNSQFVSVGFLPCLTAINAYLSNKTSNTFSPVLSRIFDMSYHALTSCWSLIYRFYAKMDTQIVTL